MNAFNVILTGEGGQGVVTAGSILSQAVIKNGYNVVMSELHGLSQRGGSITVEVRIGDVYGPISFRTSYDLILGFEPMEAMRILENVDYPTMVILNTERISPVGLGIEGAEYPDIDSMLSGLPSFIKIRRVDASSIARSAGSVRATNIAMLSASLDLCVPGLDIESLEYAIRSNFSSRILQVNMETMRRAVHNMKSDPMLKG